MGAKLHLTLLVLTVSIIATSTGLECYFCEHVDGFSKTDDCKQKLPDTVVRNVTEGFGVQRAGVASKQLLDDAMNRITGGASVASSSGGMYPYCVKVVGKEGENEVIMRFGLSTPSPDLNGQCIGGERSTICYCNKNRCNNAASVGLSVGVMLFGVIAAILKFQL